MDWGVITDLLPVAAGLIIIVSGILAIRRLLSSDGDVFADDEPNIVSLYQFPRGSYAPNLSPFCHKLETYLRMTNIPYKNVFGMKMSSKGKLPWIRYNGVSVADSQMCIEFLNKKFDVDLDKKLNPEQRGVARAFLKLIEDSSLMWYLGLERWVYARDKPWLSEAGVNWFIQWYVGRKIKKAAYYQGMGRHTREELEHMMKKDIQSISSYIGIKPFLMGTEPTEVDCTVFAMLIQLICNSAGSQADQYIREHHPTLLDYCDRMKRLYWPDWDECNTNGGKKTATK